MRVSPEWGCAQAVFFLDVKLDTQNRKRLAGGFVKAAGLWRAALLAGFAGFSAAAAEPAPGGASLQVRGLEGRVAVYAETNAAREAVAWLPAGTEFAVRGDLQDEAAWVRVEPPETVSVWVYRELVREGEVLADKVQVRSGAGLTFSSVGSLNKGDRVEVRGRFGDWLKIRPPADVAFWVLRDRVEPLASMPPGGEVGAANMPAQAPPEPAEAGATHALAAATRASVCPPPELAGMALADEAGQGERVLLAGLLDWGGVGGFTSPYCLVGRQANGDTRPLCHLFAPAAAAAPHVGVTVAIEGARWRLKGVDLPVVVAETLRALE